MKITHLMVASAASLTLLPCNIQAGSSYVATGKGVAQPPPPPVDPCAGPISYSNIELLYAYTSFDNNLGSNNHTNGAQLNIEYSPFKSFYLTAGGEWFNESGADLWILHGGIGGYLPLTDNIHLAADGGILWTDAEFDNNAVAGNDSHSDTGWYIRPHLRGKWGCFEAHAGALYRDMGDFNTGGSNNGRWAGFAQLYYHLTPSLDLTAGVLADNDLTQVTGGIRWRF